MNNNQHAAITIVEPFTGRVLYAEGPVLGYVSQGPASHLYTIDTESYLRFYLQAAEYTRATIETISARRAMLFSEYSPQIVYLATSMTERGIGVPTQEEIPNELLAGLNDLGVEAEAVMQSIEVTSVEKTVTIKPVASSTLFGMGLPVTETKVSVTLKAPSGAELTVDCMPSHKRRIGNEFNRSYKTPPSVYGAFGQPQFPDSSGPVFQQQREDEYPQNPFQGWGLGRPLAATPTPSCESQD